MNPEESTPGQLDTLRNAVQAVVRSKELLTSARLENLSYCEGELGTAVQCLEKATRDLDARNQFEPSELRITARRLQRETAGLVRLLRQAQEFHNGWNALSESSLAGYTASGDPAPVGRDYSRIALKG
jgi:hypothetical protein